jgi:hypothetical protein
MKSIRKEDVSGMRVNDLRKTIRSQVEKETLSAYNEAISEGKFPWEGMWLTPQLISLVQQKLKKKDKTVFFELMVLILFVIFMLQMFANFTLGLLPVQYSKQLKDNSVHTRNNTGLSDKKVDIVPVSEAKINSVTSSGAYDPHKSSINSGISKKSAANLRGTVRTRSVRLRKGPGTHFAVISKLRYGEGISVKEQKGPWLRISASQSPDGWVYRHYVDVNN